MDVKTIEEKPKCEKKKRDYYALVIIFFLMEHCFFLINTKLIKGYEDIVLVSYMAFCVYIFLKYKNFRMIRYRFAVPCIFVSVLVVVSSIVANNLYEQGVIIGIRAQRMFLVIYLSYFCITKYVCIDDRNKETLKAALYTSAWIELIICLTQYALSDVYMFAYVAKSIRYGGVRLQFDSNILTFMYFLGLHDFLNGKNIKKTGAFIILILIYNLFVLRGRLMVISMIASSVIMILLWKKNIMLKGALILSGALVFIALLFTPIMSSYLSVFDSGVRDRDGSYQVRVDAKEYYSKQLKDSPIVGRGFINYLNKKATHAAGMEKGYALNDNGFKGFEYQYGYIGVMWIVILFAYMFFYGWIAYRRNREYTSLAYGIYLAAILSNIVNFYWSWTPVYLVITLALLENNFVKFNLNNKKKLSVGEAV